MKISIKLIILIFTINLSSCKKPLEYKYSEKEDMFSCTSIDMELIKEAVYAFEDFLLPNKDNKPNALNRSYTVYLRTSLTNTLPDIQKMDNHLIKVFYKLKNIESLWITKGDKTSLNYNHDIIKCIVENITDKDIKTSFNALLSTNSMKSKTITPAIQPKSFLITRQKGLAVYVALDLFYAKFFEMDFTETE